jgi:DNA-binding IclR family transcriptional regulator
MSKITTRERVLKAFKESKDPMGPQLVAKKAKVNKNTARRLVQELTREGKLRRNGRGLYVASFG